MFCHVIDCEGNGFLERGVDADDRRLLLGAGVERTAGVDDIKLVAGDTCFGKFDRESYLMLAIVEFYC